MNKNTIKRKVEFAALLDNHDKIKNEIEELKLFDERAIVSMILTWEYHGETNTEILSRLNEIDTIYRLWYPYTIEEYLDDVMDDPQFVPIFYNGCISPLENLENAVKELNRNRSISTYYKIVPQSDTSLMLMQHLINGEFRVVLHYNEDEYRDMFHSIINKAYEYVNYKR